MNDCLKSYLDSSSTPKAGMKDICADFRQKIANIQKIGLSHGIHPDELLVMINRTYMYCWDTIPANKFDELGKFIHNNHDKKLMIIDPEFAYKLEKFKDEEHEKIYSIKKIAAGMGME